MDDDDDKADGLSDEDVAENLSSLAGVGPNFAEEAAVLSPDIKLDAEIRESRSWKAEVAEASIGRFLPATNVGAKGFIGNETRSADIEEI